MSAANPAGVSEILFVNTPTAVSDTRDANLHFFAQDNWQLNPRLTITAGMRVAHQYGWYKRGGPLTGLSRVLPQRGLHPAEGHLHLDRLLSRFAVTYDVTGEGRTVIKASGEPLTPTTWVRTASCPPIRRRASR